MPMTKYCTVTKHTGSSMAGNNKNPKWWAMKRAKDKKIKRRAKKAAGNKPGGDEREVKLGDGKLPPGGDSRAGNSKTISNKSASQKSHKDQHKQWRKQTENLQGGRKAADSLTADVGSTGKVEKPQKTQTKANQILSTEEMLQTLSKQARKRRLKRLREKQNRQSEKKGVKSKTGTGSKLGKDKETGRKEAPSKKRSKQFKEKKHDEKSKATKEISPPALKHDLSERVQVEGRDQLGRSLPDDVRLEGRKNLKRKDKTEHLMRKKKMDVANDNTGLVNKKEERKVADKDDGQSVPSDEGGADTNWLNLMKTVQHGPHKKKWKKESDRTANTTEQTRKPEIWFDDVDPILLNESGADGLLSHSSSKAVPEDHGKTEQATGVDGLPKYVAMDCEMVGIGPGGKESMLARVSLVNQHGTCIYDKYVAPQEDITHYRTSISGIKPANLENAEDFTKVQEEVSNILKGRILVGHALHNDLKVLFLNHPKSMMRDTSTYRPFRDLCQGRKPSLKKLCELILKVKIQEAEHNSVEDAQAAMNLFLRYRKKWERETP